MELSDIIPHIEALIFASEKPVTSLEITELINNAFGFMEDKITLDQVEAALDGVIEKYRSDFYPFEVRESGGGWQFLTKKDFHKTVAQLNGDKYLKRLSNAALETLSIIAYKQPITKGEIEAIRGVSADYSIQKLLEKELIIISGRNEELPGKPLVYVTSKSFMDYFGLNSPDDLPKIKEVLADQAVDPTVVSNAGAQDEALPEGAADGEKEDINLVVLENGELDIRHTENSGDVSEDAAAAANEAAAIADEPVEEKALDPVEDEDRNGYGSNDDVPANGESDNSYGSGSDDDNSDEEDIDTSYESIEGSGEEEDEDGLLPDEESSDEDSDLSDDEDDFEEEDDDFEEDRDDDDDDDIDGDYDDNDNNDDEDSDVDSDDRD